jgi:hypothetical protein
LLRTRAWPGRAGAPGAPTRPSPSCPWWRSFSSCNCGGPILACRSPISEKRCTTAAHQRNPGAGLASQQPRPGRVHRPGPARRADVGQQPALRLDPTAGPGDVQLCAGHECLLLVDLPPHRAVGALRRSTVRARGVAGPVRQPPLHLSAVSIRPRGALGRHRQPGFSGAAGLFPPRDAGRDTAG